MKKKVAWRYALRVMRDSGVVYVVDLCYTCFQGQQTGIRVMIQGPVIILAGHRGIGSGTVGFCKIYFRMHDEACPFSARKQQKQS